MSKSTPRDRVAVALKIIDVALSPEFCATLSDEEAADLDAFLPMMRRAPALLEALRGVLAYAALHAIAVGCERDNTAEVQAVARARAALEGLE